ncbi:phosphotransferase [Myxococcota bacterium]|nr:phosphotransferase [Myxococcota bacterium]|tara:strand:+ start:762 stop:1766 length:1005 start_codon:yes stop_codon:yes gene_type:complete
MKNALDLENFIRQKLSRRVLSSVTLQPGLGFRKFLRVKLDGEPNTIVARISPKNPLPEHAQEPPLEPLRSILQQAKLPVPKSFGSKEDGTLELLEDLGDTTLESYVKSLNPEMIEHLYKKILSDIPVLQNIKPLDTLPAFQRRLDAELLDSKAQLFAKHVLGNAHLETVRSAFACVAEYLNVAPFRLAHRDFQSQNIMLENRPLDEIIPRWIDIQGAFLAPPEYDAVCLLHDSYIKLGKKTISRLSEQLRLSLPDKPEKEIFTQRFNLLTLTRKSKDFARFLEAKTLRNDNRYSKYLDHTWEKILTASRDCASLDSRLEKLWKHLSQIKGRPTK